MTSNSPISQSTQNCVDALNFIIGRDRAGHWIVVEGHGLYGGIFGSQRAAARYAKFEAGSRLGNIAISAEPLELYDVARRAA
jgi:hypothetical protein